MIKFMSFEFLGLSHTAEFHERLKMPFTVAKYLLRFRRYLTLKSVQNMHMKGLVMSFTQPNVTKY